MFKPIVFFSHSSKDKDVILRLKKVFTEKTGGSIDVFLSSDGLSIPLGRNWVYKVQENLECAGIMIVFITPNSITSRWIYFEAGYSYSKDIRVVPVGFLGVDLNQIGPPLSLLQGFNITSADTLNNLIALTNEQFKHKHQPSFTNDEYSEIVGSGQEFSVNPVQPILHCLDGVHLSLYQKSDDLKDSPQQLIPEIIQFLEDQNLEVQSGDKFINLRGVSIWTSVDVKPALLEVVVDPFVLHNILPILNGILKIISTNEIQNNCFVFELTPDMDVISELFKITGRLYDDPITLQNDKKISYKDIIFHTGYYLQSSGRSSKRGNAFVKLITKDELNLQLLI